MAATINFPCFKTKSQFPATTIEMCNLVVGDEATVSIVDHDHALILEAGMEPVLIHIATLCNAELSSLEYGTDNTIVAVRNNKTEDYTFAMVHSAASLEDMFDGADKYSVKSLHTYDGEYDHYLVAVFADKRHFVGIEYAGGMYMALRTIHGKLGKNWPLLKSEKVQTTSQLEVITCGADCPHQPRENLLSQAPYTVVETLTGDQSDRFAVTADQSDSFAVLPEGSASEYPFAVIEAFAKCAGSVADDYKCESPAARDYIVSQIKKMRQTQLAKNKVDFDVFYVKTRKTFKSLPIDDVRYMLAELYNQVISPMLADQLDDNIWTLGLIIRHLKQ